MDNDEIMAMHVKHMCNPEREIGGSQLYDEDCVDEMLGEARADEQAKSAKLYETLKKLRWFAQCDADALGEIDQALAEFEKDEAYHAIAQERIAKDQRQRPPTLQVD